jgi:hypothetical protein
MVIKCNNGDTILLVICDSSSVNFILFDHTIIGEKWVLKLLLLIIHITLLSIKAQESSKLNFILRMRRS